MPCFVLPGEKIKEPLPWLPGIYRFSIDILLKEIEKALSVGIDSVILFECAEKKDEGLLFSKQSLLARCIRAVKGSFPQLTLISDLCVCSQTESGHCRLIEKGRFDNKKTLEALKNLALFYAESGVDIISVSAMIEGQTEEIRRVLDKEGLDEAVLMPCLKFASYLYQPARTAFSAEKSLLYPKPYHLPVNSRSRALKWCQREVVAGADIIMIKPALNNLDVIYAAKRLVNTPIVGFQPSGSYAISKFGLERCIMEQVSMPAPQKNGSGLRLVSHDPKYPAGSAISTLNTSLVFLMKSNRCRSWWGFRYI